MNDAKHTPGPWKIWREKRDTQAEFCICVGIEGVRLASLPDMSAIGEDEANARLIAAAPDLLAACKRAEWQYEQLGDSRAIQMLRAAIAKAEGK